MDVIDELIAHCEAWEPWARVMGNVCAGDAAQALRSLRAENAELQHELTKGIHTCGPTCRKTPRCAEMADLRAELAACNENLAKANQQIETLENMLLRRFGSHMPGGCYVRYADYCECGWTQERLNIEAARKGEDA